MKNRQVEAAWAYHDTTKHSYQSIRTNPHYLDWENQPMAFKIYSKLPAIPLPQNLASAAMPALSAISTVLIPASSEARLSMQALAEILYLSAGITKRRSYPGGEMLFRAAACTGALYHIDLYLVCGDLEGLDAGVYQFSPQDFALRRLRAGDYRSVPRQCDRRRAGNRERAVRNRERVDVLAQRLEVSSACLPALLLGQRHNARQSSSGRGVARNSGKNRARLCR